MTPQRSVGIVKGTVTRHDPHVARGTSRTCDKHTTSDTCPEYFPLIMKQFIVERVLHHLVRSGKRVCERLETDSNAVKYVRNDCLEKTTGRSEF